MTRVVCFSQWFFEVNIPKHSICWSSHRNWKLFWIAIDCVTACCAKRVWSWTTLMPFSAKPTMMLWCHLAALLCTYFGSSLLIFIPNYCYNGSTNRFVPTKHPLSSQSVERPTEPKDVLPQMLWARSDSTNATALSSQFTASLLGHRILPLWRPCWVTAA